MRQLTSSARPAEPTQDCGPAPADDHPFLTALMEGLAVAGALWYPTGALAAMSSRRQRQAADCEDAEAGVR
jgi:hypothetical protein